MYCYTQCNTYIDRTHDSDSQGRLAAASQRNSKSEKCGLHLNVKTPENNVSKKYIKPKAPFSIVDDEHEQVDHLKNVLVK